MTVSYWIQNSDFSNPTGLDDSNPFQSVAHILQMIETYDWGRENAYEKKSHASADDCCPAGIGIVKPGGTMLHICPVAVDRTAQIHLHYKTEVKLLGLIKTTKGVVNSFENVAWSLFEPIIELFIKSDYDKIALIIASQKP